MTLILIGLCVATSSFCGTYAALMMVADAHMRRKVAQANVKRLASM